MSKLARLLLIVFLLFTSCSIFAQCAGGYSGTFSIGTAQRFPTLKRALDSLKIFGVSGPVILELQAGYDPATETYPIRPDSIPCAGPAMMITIRPASGTGPFELTSDSIATIDLVKTKYLRIDGRPAGMGTARNITIRNGSLTGSAIRFINDASFNEILHLNVQGANNSNFGGVVYIAGTTGTKGNDSNRIASCFIHESIFLPSHGIFAAGTSLKPNTGNIITDCAVFNFYNSTGTSSGITVINGNEKYRITGNSVFQQAGRNYGGGPAVVSGIYVDTRFDTGHVIRRNFIGGTAPGAGGQKMQLNYGFRFTGIYVTNRAGTGTHSHVDSNTITNLLLQSNQVGSSFAMIAAGHVLGSGSTGFSGTCSGNLIGSTSSDSAIRIITLHPISSGSIYFAGIAFGPRVFNTADTVFVQRNTIAGILVDSPSTGPVDLRMIMPYSTDNIPSNGVNRYVVSENIIGSSIRTNSITSRVHGLMCGVFAWATNNYAIEGTIRNNLIANMTTRVQLSNGGVHSIKGIMLQNFTGSTAMITVTGNEIHHLLQLGNVGVPEAAVGIRGIIIDRATISYNRIHHLRSDFLSWPGGDPNTVAGIYLENAAASVTGDITISHNTVHTVYGSRGDNWGNAIFGMYIRNPQAKVTNLNNNMIHVGVDTAGLALNNQQYIYGIYDHSGKTVALHNTVYVGGDPSVVSMGESSAFFTDQTTATGRVIRNNILANRRANSSTGNMKNSCIEFSGNAATVPPASMDFNLYYAPGNNGVIGWMLPGSQTTLAGWRTASGKDSNSIYANPNFVNANGSGTAIDLHIVSPSPVESAGSTVGTTVTDIDGEIRANLSPVDIGADAGVFGAPALPDLGFSNFSAPANASSGSTINVSYTEINRTATAAGAHQVVVYFSPDNILTPGANGDTVLGQVSVPGMSGNSQSVLQTLSVTIPCSATTGTRYLFFEADATGLIPETNESDNIVTASLSVTQPAVSITSPDTTICQGNAVVLAATGATSYSWTPSNGLSNTTTASVTASPASTTTYIVTGTTNGCTTTDQVLVTVIPVVTPTISISQTTCNATAASFTAGITNGGVSPVIRWYVNNILSATTGSTFILNSPVNGMQVYAKLETSASCPSVPSVNSATRTINCISTSVTQLNAEEIVLVYPNPVSTTLTVHAIGNTKPSQLTILDVFGRPVRNLYLQPFAGERNWKINVSGLASGSYLLLVRTRKGVSYTPLQVTAK
jgi:hypothetical protein